MTKQEKLDYLRQYLTQTSGFIKEHPQGKFDRLILEQGTPFLESVLSKTIAETKEWKKNRKPKSKQCFYNSQMYCLTGKTGEYYEGYCYDSLIPVHHAWIVIDGKVVDFTLEARDRVLARQKIESNSLDTVYLGVTVPKKTIMQNIVKRGMSEPVAYRHYIDAKVMYI